MSLSMWGHYAVSTSAVVTALGIIYWPFYRGGRAVGRRFERFVHDEIAEVLKEVQPNGGQSMRDSVEETRRVVQVIDTRQQKMLAKQDRTWDAIVKAGLIEP